MLEERLRRCEDQEEWVLRGKLEKAWGGCKTGCDSAANVKGLGLVAEPHLSQDSGNGSTRSQRVPQGSTPMTCCASVASFTHPASSHSAVEGRFTTRHQSGTSEKRDKTTSMFLRQDQPALLPKAPKPTGKEGREEMLHFCIIANGVQ